MLRKKRWTPDLGAVVRPGGVRFRVWGPRARRVGVVVDGLAREVPLRSEGRGYFSAWVPGVRAGALYRYRVDGKDLLPDPCSRSQPEGPHGPSQVVDPTAHVWRDGGWRGRGLEGQVFYELHVGAFTSAGTFDAAIERLDRLKALGVTTVELMPVAEFPGAFNWGYDGVGLYAPSHVYGGPEGLRRFVDAAHARGLGVILDVVYNHLGPDGNYLPRFSRDYFHRDRSTDWGDALNFDGPGSEGVRHFFVENACHWIAEYHLDGLRLDATQDIHDEGPEHVLAALSKAARRAAGPRRIVLVAENESQNARLVAPLEAGGYGLDALWVDDFHHAARTALTGRREAYFSDYRGSPQELISSVKRGFLYQGQRYDWQDQPRGTAVTGEKAASFVFYLQNHDQTANTLDGRRLSALSEPGCYRALTALWLLAPETPLFFMGQENGTARPFLFFAEHAAPLSRAVLKGRKGFLAQFPSFKTRAAQAAVPDPGDRETFYRSTLRESDWVPSPAFALHRDLLRLRRWDRVIAAQDRRAVDGAVLAPEAFALRFFGGGGDDRLLLVNLGAALDMSPVPEPLLAPPAGRSWRLRWSSDHPRYGGPGALPPVGKGGHWRLEGASAVFLSPRKTR